MKRIQLTLGAVLALAVMAIAQQPQTPKTQAPKGTAPAQAQAAPVWTGPKAKTTDEYAAYKAAINVVDAAQAENAANEFATKYPTSELRSLLFNNAMRLYQESNNAGKTIDMGRKTISLDPDNLYALATVAMVLAEQTRETDLDRDEKLAEASKDAQRTIEKIDTLVVVPNTPAEKIAELKNYLLSMAYSSMGSIETVKGNYPGAEQSYRKAIEIAKAQPDPYTLLRLAIVLDRQKKYTEAMVTANKALDFAPPGHALRDSIMQERSRLMKLASAPTPAPAAPPK